MQREINYETKRRNNEGKFLIRFFIRANKGISLLYHVKGKERHF